MISLVSQEIHTIGDGVETIANKITESKAKGWLCLLSDSKAWPERDTHPTLKEVETKQVFVSPDNLSPALAKDVVDAIESLPRPLVISCASGNRAGACGWLSVAQQLQLGISDVLQCASGVDAFVGSPVLVNWISEGISQKYNQVKHPMKIRQFFESESSTYSYLIWDDVTKDAILVDPVDKTVDRDISFVSELGLKLKYGVNTHAHADHITGTALLKQRLSGLQSVISLDSGARADVKIQHGDKIEFGERYLQARKTPGHTAGCMSFLADDASFVLTGDALLIRGCGRTDFQGGSASTLYEAVHSQLFTLPKSTIVYPAHDYKGRTASSIGEEMKYNPRLGEGLSLEKFVDIMDNLGLSYPKMIDVAVPANMRCGYND